MAEKNITEKILMSHADIFADCINALVYSGEQRLNAENTRPAPTESFYKGKKLHIQFYDTGRFLTERNNIIVQYIIENKTKPEEQQVFRKASYQGGAYRQQMGIDTPAYAVICIVLAWSGKANQL